MNLTVEKAVTAQLDDSVGSAIVLLQQPIICGEGEIYANTFGANSLAFFH